MEEETVFKTEKLLYETNLYQNRLERTIKTTNLIHEILTLDEELLPNNFEKFQKDLVRNYEIQSRIIKYTTKEFLDKNKLIVTSSQLLAHADFLKLFLEGEYFKKAIQNELNDNKYLKNLIKQVSKYEWN